jgi:TrwC relaxase
MTLHKLTTGDGYMYLIRQLAAGDATHRGRPSLADYYSSKGESAGVWMGSGLASLGVTSSTPGIYLPADARNTDLWSVEAGSQVTEAQMKALYGEGLHPNADEISAHLIERGARAKVGVRAAHLGRPFPVNDAENEFMARLREAYGDHNQALGLERRAALDPEVRARIRTAVGRDMFAETYGREPSDERELTGFVARQSRSQTTAVAGYDMVFRPVKSVSALWAIAPIDIARVIEDCHHQAVTEAIAFLEEHAAFSRMGAGGVAQVDTTGLIVAAFDHRDSRNSDPLLHTHCAVSNKVCVIGADGIAHWLALDGQPLHAAAVAASELYNTRIEDLLIERLALRFAEVPSKTRGDKLPVREIVAPSELQDKWVRLQDRWSSRSAAIDHRVGQLAKEFQAEHGREPTAAEAFGLNQRANLETRQGKHEPRSFAEQRQTWGTEALEVFGRRDLAKLISDITVRGNSSSLDDAGPPKKSRS